MKRMIDNKEFEKIKKDVDDCIKKSDISGLVKNDGTIDTNIYAKISDLDKGIYYTTTAPTLDSGTNYYKLSTSNLVNANDNFTIKSGDIVVYVNNGSVDSIYVWSGTASGSFLLLELVGSFGGGKQLYQHNITCRYDIPGGGYVIAFFTIIHQKSTAFTFDELTALLISFGANDFYTAYPAGGYKVQSGSFNNVSAVSATSSSIKMWYGNYVSQAVSSISEVRETIVAL